MPAPSNSALFKGIGGDLGHRLSLSPASVISDHFHVFFLSHQPTLFHQLCLTVKLLVKNYITHDSTKKKSNQINS